MCSFYSKYIAEIILKGLKYPPNQAGWYFLSPDWRLVLVDTRVAQATGKVE